MFRFYWSRLNKSYHFFCVCTLHIICSMWTWHLDVYRLLWFVYLICLWVDVVSCASLCSMRSAVDPPMVIVLLFRLFIHKSCCYWLFCWHYPLGILIVLFTKLVCEEWNMSNTTPCQTSYNKFLIHLSTIQKGVHKLRKAVVL